MQQMKYLHVYDPSLQIWVMHVVIVVTCYHPPVLLPYTRFVSMILALHPSHVYYVSCAVYTAVHEKKHIWWGQTSYISDPWTALFRAY